MIRVRVGSPGFAAEGANSVVEVVRIYTRDPELVVERPRHKRNLAYRRQL
jgi:hypothetical protein